MTSVTSLLSPTKGLLKIDNESIANKENCPSSSCSASSSSSSCNLDETISMLVCSPLKKKEVFDFLVKKYSERLILSVEEPQSIWKKSSKKRRNQSIKVANMLDSIDGLKLFKTPAPATLSPASPAYNSLRNSTELPSFNNAVGSPIYSDPKQKILQTYSHYIRFFAQAPLKSEPLLSEEDLQEDDELKLLSLEASDKTLLRQMVLFREFETIKNKSSSAARTKETTEILENYKINDYKNFNKKPTTGNDNENIDVDDLLSEMDNHLMKSSSN